MEELTSSFCTVCASFVGLGAPHTTIHARPADGQRRWSFRHRSSWLAQRLQEQGLRGGESGGRTYDHLLYMRNEIVDGGIRGSTLMVAELKEEGFNVKSLHGMNGFCKFPHFMPQHLLTVERGKLYALRFGNLTETDLLNGECRILAKDVGPGHYACALDGYTASWAIGCSCMTSSRARSATSCLARFVRF